MKKLLLVFSLVVMTAGLSFGSNYKLNDEAVDNLFAQADDVSLVADAAEFSMPALAEPTKTGYLIRAFFCGSFGLHRSYMGTGGKTLWYYYLCIPVAGGVVACVDFWYVVIKGDEALSKYKDNPKWVVWND